MFRKVSDQTWAYDLYVNTCACTSILHIVLNNSQNSEKNKITIEKIFHNLVFCYINRIIKRIYLYYYFKSLAVALFSSACFMYSINTGEIKAQGGDILYSSIVFPQYHYCCIRIILL